MKNTLNSDNKTQWDIFVKQYKKVTDKLGKPIDERILDTVIALNALNINTIASCEGHLEHGIAAPWIDIGYPTNKNFEKQAKDIWPRLQAKEDNGDYKEAQRLMLSYNLLLDKMRKPALLTAKKISALLREFYLNKNGSFENKLILKPIGFMYRLESQGAFLQPLATKKDRKFNLNIYRKEMDEFTKFLIDKYNQK